MEHPRPVNPSQRYSPVGEYTCDNHYEIIQSTRQPLGESTGNAQPQNLAALALCHPQFALSPPIDSIPTPPIAPTEILPSTYGTSFRSHRSIHRDVSSRESNMCHSRGGRNPIYSWKYFADYRIKVTQKEAENEDPTWPLHLEDAFLDALILIPLMGRQKFSSKGVLYGRNMLITEYLWICHWLVHPSAPGEIVPVGKAREKHPVYRGRKQVSSHIQVLKGFFLSHPLFHFFFLRKENEKDKDGRSNAEDEEERKSFNSNQVLIALADGRLPDERPNYDYFARLLGGDSEVFVRPKTCWIYVSSNEVTLSDDNRKAFASDGTCLESDGYTADGTRLEFKGDYPHLVLNSNKDTMRDLKQADGTQNVLLHEYTKNMTQKESTSIKDISAKWDSRFPELRKKLLSALDETHPSHERTSRCVVGPCDTIHFEVVLDLHATSQFPPGTHLDGVVQLSICCPELAHHNWKSVTSVDLPEELENPDTHFWSYPNECDLSGRGNAKDTIEVPFPATSWASNFIKLARYVTAERERRAKEPHEARRPREDDGDDVPQKPLSKVPTAKNLLSQVAMHQEIWSSPNDGAEKRTWTRRSIILWTFVNVHNKVDDKGKIITVPPATNWRFLSKIDPQSQYHQQRAYLSGSPNVSRSNVMSPDPGYAHHINASMHENFSSAYDAPNITLPGQQHAHFAGLNPLDSFPKGLATPPPTACLPSTYAQSFDSATIASTGIMHQHFSFLSDTSGTDNQPTLMTDHTADPFLSGLSVPNVNNYEGTDAEANLQDWTSRGIDGANWTTTYVDSQNSLSRADVPKTTGDMNESSQWHAATAHISHDNTPWDEGKHTLWGTPNTSKSQSILPTQSTANDIWSKTSQQPWMQAVAAVADRPANQNIGWADLGENDAALQYTTLIKGRKRARHDDDRENYPDHAYKKHKNVPTAAMDDGHGFF